jgi:protein-tyrosine phosphatase
VPAAHVLRGEVLRKIIKRWSIFLYFRRIFDMVKNFFKGRSGGKKGSSNRGGQPEILAQDCDLSVLMVCMGNICRSPLAEGWLSHRLTYRPQGPRILVDSAGTHGYHAGSAPDPRAQAAAARRGFHIGHLGARQVVVEDLERFDLVLAMDRDNLDYLHALASGAHTEKLRLLLEFAPNAGSSNVPDPYYGGDTGFERVLDLVEQAVDGLLPELEKLAGSRTGER